jgi:hypothetical protein
MGDEDELNINPGWVLLAFGLWIILDGLFTARRGWTTQAYRHRWGYFQNLVVDREVSPIQFWFLIWLQFLIGFVVIFFGVWTLLARAARGAA